MKPGKLTAAQIKRCKSEKDLMFILDAVYKAGAADALGGTLDKEGRFLHVPKGKVFETICPKCGETLVLDIEGLLNKEEQND